MLLLVAEPLALAPVALATGSPMPRQGVRRSLDAQTFASPALGWALRYDAATWTATEASTDENGNDTLFLDFAADGGFDADGTSVGFWTAKGFTLDECLANLEEDNAGYRDWSSFVALKRVAGQRHRWVYAPFIGVPDGGGEARLIWTVCQALGEDGNFLQIAGEGPISTFIAREWDLRLLIAGLALPAAAAGCSFAGSTVPAPLAASGERGDGTGSPGADTGPGDIDCGYALPAARDLRGRADRMRVDAAGLREQATATADKPGAAALRTLAIRGDELAADIDTQAAQLEAACRRSDVDVLPRMAFAADAIDPWNPVGPARHVHGGRSNRIPELVGMTGERLETPPVLPSS